VTPATKSQEPRAKSQKRGQGIGRPEATETSPEKTAAKNLQKKAWLSGVNCHALKQPHEWIYFMANAD
jgi:hypothetical protein